MRTTCTTALKNTPDIRGMVTSRLSILDISYQILRAYQRLPTKSSQLSSTTVKTRPKYFNKVTIAGGLP